MEGGRAGAEGQGVLGAGGGAEFLLEGVYLRAKGGNPVGGEGFGDVLLLTAGHMGRGEVDARTGHKVVYTSNSDATRRQSLSRVTTAVTPNRELPRFQTKSYPLPGVVY
jgi:hypothetical protein